ncbi:hypothetical protein [Nocardiopsis sp. NPDC006938]|uniref:hypothetical protein n=1 Tax=Nocardiopsis sp. NPDC006938 TaxID=3364337 RepID=UPI0036BC54AF
MAIRTSACWTLHCDMPHDHDEWENADGTPHFETPEAALSYATSAGWTLEAGVLRCDVCAAVLQCAQQGHQWRSWPTETGAQVRSEYCARCDDNRLLAIACD